MKPRISKAYKILFTIFKMSDSKKVALKYEDIIVETFRLFPDDFHIQYYPQYPDSDMFRRAIYFDLREKGYLRIAKKECILTDQGIAIAIKLQKIISGKSSSTVKSDSDANTRRELNRILNLPGYKMYMNDKLNELIDQDLYDFYKITVKTSPIEKFGRINQTNRMIEYSLKLGIIPLSLKEYIEYLQQKFQALYGVK